MNQEEPLKVLIVEDNPHDAELEEREIRKGGLNITVQRVDTMDSLEPALKTWEPDLVLSDFSMPQLDGLTVLKTVRAALPEVPFLFVSGTIGEERAIEALKNGATDYVVKDRMAGLVVRVRRALDEAREKKRLHKLEEELRQAQKMDALGRLAGAVAHDFNNLLTAILSYGQTAIEKLSPTDAARGDVEQIYKAGESAVNLTRQLLSFSRKQPLDLRPVDLHAVVSGMIPLLSRLLGKAIEIEYKGDPAVKAVRADTGGLEQILLNLAINSRDAMPRGGKLTIETSRMSRSKPTKDFLSQQSETSVSLRVTDTGVGIDSKTLPRIFEPFFTTKSQGGGTGLGLSTVFGIVQTFGGSVAVVSEVGHGTTFWIHLQEVPQAEVAKEASIASPKPTVGKETVLVAEDSAPILTLVTAVLRAKGYQVLNAMDGLEAVRVFDDLKGKIDLLITDAVMPRLGGYDLIKKLRAAKPDLKVLVMSGNVEESSVDAQGVRVLGKPFTPSALATLVREVVEQREVPVPKTKWKILAVDDDPGVTDALHVALQPHGYEVFALHNATVALEEAKKIVPDLILLDFHMRDKLGPEVAVSLKNDPVTGGIPIVFLSGIGDLDHKELGKLSGASEYLLKPISPEKLLAVIRRTIREGRKTPG